MAITDDDLAALGRVVLRTRHERFRELLDPYHPGYNPAYWLAVRALDTGTDIGDESVTLLPAGIRSPRHGLAGG
jgi:hypothetical protein